MDNDKGFTLVEVVASIVLLTIIILSFAQLIIQSNKVAAVNNEKLVTVNLADAMLAKARATKGVVENTITGSTFTLDRTNTNPQKATFTMNSKEYLVIFEASQRPDKPSEFTESELNLVNVVVTVCPRNKEISDYKDDSCEGKSKGISEGYIDYD